MDAHKKIAQMREERAGLITAMREQNDKAVAESRDFTAEEAQEYGRREARFDELSSIIDRAERLAGLTVDPASTRAAATPDAEERTAGDDAESAEVRRATQTPEYRAAFAKYVRNQAGSVERRALAVARDTDGGFTVPEEWSAKLIEAMAAYGAVRATSTILSTSTGVDIHVPKVEDAMVSAQVGEEQPFTESDDDYDEAILGAYKYGHIVKVSDELVQDSMFDIDAHVRARAARAVALKEGAKLAVGTGSNEPTGLLTAATVGVTAASATTVTFDELIDLYFSVPAPYRNLGSWLMGDGLVKIAAKLKDSEGRYLWQPSLQAGTPDTFYGKPVRTDPFIVDPAINAVTAVYGDLSGYWVRDAGGVVVKVLVEKYADTGQIGYRVHKRTDGDLVDGNGVRSLKMAAA
jgi:HK97 family phage major capsid protein